MNVSFAPSIASIDAHQWNSLHQPEDSLFCRYQFLYELENSGVVCAKTGWQPLHLLLQQDNQLIAAMPMYVKNHSYGEFVFDWSWANAYRQANIDYYPKLVTSIPFTPVTGARLLYDRHYQLNDLLQTVIPALIEFIQRKNLSSWHCLFPQTELLQALQQYNDMLPRYDIQFHWRNRSYQCFDDFLSQLRSTKRKQIRRERRRVNEQSITIKRYFGHQITSEMWQAFYDCYCDTYYKRSGHAGYLNRDFFDGILQSMSDNIMLVCCYQQLNDDSQTDDEIMVASALFFYDKQHLYGRYWGALEDIDCLHFETCFYQGIEFCIEQNIEFFNPGTQGEHKLFRGFEPTTTHSCHWIAHPQFRRAITDFLTQETQHIEQYANHAQQFLPFHRKRSINGER